MNKPYFQISEVQVEQFATFTLPDTDSTLINVEANLGLTLNDEKRLINCSIKIVLRLLDDIIITLQVKCGYSIDRDKWGEWVNSESQKSDIPLDFVSQIAEQTLATARGVLYAKTENTRYSKFLIPIFDLTDTIKANHK